MNDEKMRILSMIENGTITSDEGLKLIEAIDSKKEEIALKKSEGKWIRVKVIDGDDTKVNVNIPLALAKAGMNIGKKYATDAEGLENIDFDEIIRLIEEGAEGKIVEVEDGNTLVEVFVE